MTRLCDRTLAAALLLSLVCATASAVQVPVLNVEKLRKDASDDGASGAVTAGLTVGGGNVYTLKVDLSGRMFLRAGRHRGLAILSVGFASRSAGGQEAAKLSDLLEEEARYEDASLAHLRYGFVLSETWALEGFTQYQVDEFLLLERRILVGAGARLLAAESDRGTVHLGAGYMIERERLDTDRVVESAEATFHRVSSYVAAQWALTGSSTLGLTGYFQPRFDEPSDYRLLGEGTVEVSLTDRLGFVLPLRVRYDSDPARVLEESTPVTPVDFEIQPSLRASF